MTRMYIERIKNIASFRGCSYNCSYCVFKRQLKRVNCPKCKAFKPHEHLESFNQRPPRTVRDKFITIGLSGDVAFASDKWFFKAQEYCAKWIDRTFMIQSKDPMCLVTRPWTQNVVLGTTIETNLHTIWTASNPLKSRIDYPDLSKAPEPEERKEVLRKYAKDNDIAVTIEPILDFEEDTLQYWMVELQPRWIWVGYDSGNHRLPEPELEKTIHLIDCLRQNGLTVFEKSLRKAWWEHDQIQE